MATERDFLRRLQERLPANPPDVVVGIGDDAAVLRLRAGEQIVSTVDQLVEGVHFREGWTSWELAARKAIAVSVSDLAAMGARPVGVLLSLAVPASRQNAALAPLADGFAKASVEFGIPVVGGNLTGTSGPVSLDVVALGAILDKPMLRSALRPGYQLAVTGWPGRSAAGLACLQHWGAAVPSEWSALLTAHREPMPSLRLGTALQEAQVALPFAAMDTSDGLARSLHSLAAQSQCRIVLREPAEDPELGKLARLLGTPASNWFWYGGEDYALLLGFPAEDAARLEALAISLGQRWTGIGAAESGSGVDLGGGPLFDKGWDALQDPHSTPAYTS